MKILDGIVAETGEIKSEAYLVDDPSDYLEPGSIMVCRNPGPELTPKILESGGLVTNEGGMLSHAAVVARENRIPAIVGTQDAYSRISSGDELYLEALEDEGRIYLVE